MCQEVHLSDVRSALLDYCEEDVSPEPEFRVDDLMAEFDDPFVDTIPHAIEHRERGRWLVERGDKDAAGIHRALQQNIARALRGRGE